MVLTVQGGSIRSDHSDRGALHWSEHSGSVYICVTWCSRPQNAFCVAGVEGLTSDWPVPM